MYIFKLCTYSEMFFFVTDNDNLRNCRIHFDNCNSDSLIDNVLKHNLEKLGTG